MAPYCTACDALPFEGGCSTLNNETGGSSHRSEASSSPLSIRPKTPNSIRLRSSESEPSTPGVCWAWFSCDDIDDDLVLAASDNLWLWIFPTNLPPINDINTTNPTNSIIITTISMYSRMVWNGMFWYRIWSSTKKNILKSTIKDLHSKTLNLRSIFFHLSKVIVTIKSFHSD